MLSDIEDAEDTAVRRLLLAVMQADRRDEQQLVSTTPAFRRTWSTCSVPYAGYPVLPTTLTPYSASHQRPSYNHHQQQQHSPHQHPVHIQSQQRQLLQQVKQTQQRQALPYPYCCQQALTEPPASRLTQLLTYVLPDTQETLLHLATR
ncbi:unnamed protein product [Protopolystoma xenopodis]|uniref:Uncharacterized protein n=1 Tax=Protopolystoma xenopodis TaxID=117903 RepID=A0A3S5A7T2_9PLAT|nr:unnamed protein product [Protopolystoma xenopodis]